MSIRMAHNVSLLLQRVDMLEKMPIADFAPINEQIERLQTDVGTLSLEVRQLHGELKAMKARMGRASALEKARGIVSEEQPA